jgi:hypothetical protein
MTDSATVSRSLQKSPDWAGGALIYGDAMLDRAPRIPQDWRDDAVNALRLAAMVRGDQLIGLVNRLATSSPTNN